MRLVWTPHREVVFWDWYGPHIMRLYNGTSTAPTSRSCILGLVRTQHREVVLCDWYGSHIEKLYTGTGTDPTSRSCIMGLV